MQASSSWMTNSGISSCWGCLGHSATVSFPNRGGRKVGPSGLLHASTMQWRYERERKGALSYCKKSTFFDSLFVIENFGRIAGIWLLGESEYVINSICISPITLLHFKAVYIRVLVPSSTQALIRSSRVAASHAFRPCVRSVIVLLLS